MPAKTIVKINKVRYDFVPLEKKGSKIIGMAKIMLGAKKLFNEKGILNDGEPDSFYRSKIEKKDIICMCNGYGVAFLPAFLLNEGRGDRLKPTASWFVSTGYVKDASGRGTWEKADEKSYTHVDAFVNTTCAPRGGMKNDIYLLIKVKEGWVAREEH